MEDVTWNLDPSETRWDLIYAGKVFGSVELYKSIDGVPLYQEARATMIAGDLARRRYTKGCSMGVIKSWVHAEAGPSIKLHKSQKAAIDAIELRPYFFPIMERTKIHHDPETGDFSFGEPLAAEEASGSYQVNTTLPSVVAPADCRVKKHPHKV